MEQQLMDSLDALNQVALTKNASIVLVGILPTIALKDLTKDNITPLKRPKVLDSAFTQLRGDSYKLRLEGTDQLIATLDSIMFESCNTSFQIHF